MALLAEGSGNTPGPFCCLCISFILLAEFAMKKGEYADMIQANTEDKYLLTADNIRVGHEIFFEEDHLNAYVETWFDVDRRFNLSTEDTSDYVNVYADYYPDDDRLVVTYIIIHGDGSGNEDFEVQDLADSERELIIRLMNEKCKEENGSLEMAAAFDKFKKGEE